MDVASEGAAGGGSWPARKAAGSAVAGRSMGTGAPVVKELEACKEACVLIHCLQKLADPTNNDNSMLRGMCLLIKRLAF